MRRGGVDSSRVYLYMGFTGIQTIGLRKVHVSIVYIYIYISCHINLYHVGIYVLSYLFLISVCNGFTRVQ